MTKDADTLKDLNFEQALAELEKIVAQLESGDLALEEAIKLYERGALLKQFCEDKLQQAKLRVDTITLSGGKPSKDETSKDEAE